MKISRTVSFGMGAVMALVIGSGTAYAATGGKFILGKSNAATATSTLTNTKGTALSLSSKAGTPSLKVNRTTKVANLNSDLLDGLDQSRFALAAGQVGTIMGDAQYVDFDNDQTYDAIMAFATCPAGTKMTGGGGEDDTPGGVLWLSEPVDSSTWAIASTTTPDPNATPDPSGLALAFVQCYNPRGSVAGSLRVVTPRKTIDDFPALVTRLERKLG
jgi:hypothetical protein